MNNYYPYGQNQYGYSPYSNNYGYMQPQYQQPQYQQPTVYPLTYTNGVVGAKAFPMQQPNSTVYLLDSDTPNVIYEKKADTQGKCSLKAYYMTEFDFDNVNASNQSTTTKEKGVTKKDIQKINESIIELKQLIEDMKNVQQSNTSTNPTDANGE